MSYDIGLDFLPLSMRALNALAKGGFETLEQVRAAGESELKRVPGLGRGTYHEILKVCGYEGDGYWYYLTVVCSPKDWHDPEVL